jgi:hypothetical protein
VMMLGLPSFGLTLTSPGKVADVDSAPPEGSRERDFFWVYGVVILVIQNKTNLDCEYDR